MAFSPVFQFIKATKLFCVTILKQTYERKNNLQDVNEYNQKQHF